MVTVYPLFTDKLTVKSEQVWVKVREIKVQNTWYTQTIDQKIWLKVTALPLYTKIVYVKK